MSAAPPPRILRTHLQTYYQTGHGVSNEQMMFGGGLFSALGWDEVYLPFELAGDHRRWNQIKGSGPYQAVFTMPFQGIDSWIREIAPGAVVIGWIPDDAWRFDHTRSLIAAGVYDYFVTTHADALPAYREAGGKAVLSNWGCRPDGHWALPALTQERLAQACFCGIFYGDREERLRAIAAVGPVPLEVHNCSMPDVLPPEDYYAYMSRSAFSLALTKSSHEVRQMKARLFEPQIFGSLLVTEPIAGLEQWWSPGDDCLTFETPEECQSRMTDLLADPVRFDDMTDRAFCRAVSEHTYFHRFRAIFEEIGLPVPAFPDMTKYADAAGVR